MELVMVACLIFQLTQLLARDWALPGLVVNASAYTAVDRAED